MLQTPQHGEQAAGRRFQQLGDIDVVGAETNTQLPQTGPHILIQPTNLLCDRLPFDDPPAFGQPERKPARRPWQTLCAAKIEERLQ